MATPPFYKIVNRLTNGCRPFEAAADEFDGPYEIYLAINIKTVIGTLCLYHLQGWG